MKLSLSFFRESYEELRKVSWPSREILLRHTIIVLVSVLVVMSILAATDLGLTTGFQKLIKISQPK